MGFSMSDSSVRVDFFKKSGKWYTTIAMEWTGGYSNIHIHDAFKKSLKDAVGDNYIGMDAICLEPYHEHSHPICIKDWDGGK